jgi:N-methylhydantoinase A/oxoprolinase/acetone carboxylase beta subunit
MHFSWASTLAAPSPILPSGAMIGCIVHKVPTTPDDQSIAIVQGLRDLGLLAGDATGAAQPLAIVHGMTVATNALLERRGAKTALLTTAGFADALEIGRQNRPQLYRLHQARPAALVADSHRLEIAERLDPQGNVIIAAGGSSIPRRWRQGYAPRPSRVLPSFSSFPFATRPTNTGLQNCCTPRCPTCRSR